MSGSICKIEPAEEGAKVARKSLINVRRQLVICVVILTVGLLSCTKDRASLSPSDVVRSYCKLDSDGARLGGDIATERMHKAIWELVTWEDEPGWDTALVIRGFRVLEASEEKDTAIVRVKYEVVGEMSGLGYGITTADRNNPNDPVLKSWQTTDFHLKRTPKGWQIDSPVIEPHPSAKIMISELGRRLASESKQSRGYREMVTTLNILKGAR